MDTIYKLEQKINKFTPNEFLNYLFEKEILKNNMLCPTCKFSMKLEKKDTFILGHCWRCYNKSCGGKYKRHSITKDSIFNSFGISLKLLMKIILRYAGKQIGASILNTIDISRPTYRKLMKVINNRMKIENEKMRKLGGVGSIVQVDETMMNYKCKSHRGRSSNNMTHCLCIVECNASTGKIQKVYAQIIPNKKATTIIPIICSHVNEHSTIHTDEHRSYLTLSRHSYEHRTVCHKYNFVDNLSGVHTQAVECFNNEIKYLIKMRKGIKTELRSDFISEFVWNWNNKHNIIDSIFNLIKHNN